MTAFPSVGPEYGALFTVAAIRQAIDSGITTLDTAYIYGNGHSENLVGRAITGYDRSDLTVISKLWKTWMAKDQVEVACDASLKRLARNDEIKRERKDPCDRSFQFQQRPADRSKKIW